MSGSADPAADFDRGLQHERTALAWERTAVALMVNGVILARYAASDAHPVIALIGLAQTAFGGGVLVWAGWNYEELHGPVDDQVEVVHPLAAQVVGRATLFFTFASLVLAVLVTLVD